MASIPRPANGKLRLSAWERSIIAPLQNPLQKLELEPHKSGDQPALYRLPVFVRDRGPSGLVPVWPVLNQNGRY